MSQDLTWSATEKKIARTAFDSALETTCSNLLAEVKRKVNAARAISEIWEIEDYLRNQRREIDSTFDYRYSQLTFVFARLILDGKLDESRLAGLSDDKLDIIRRFVSFSRSR